MYENGRMHGLLMAIAWLFIENILLWSQYFKYYSCFIYVHLICGIAITLLTFLASILIVGQNQSISIVFSGLHQIRGFIVMILLILLIIMGFTARFWWSSATKQPKKVHITNLAHLLVGWITILIAKYTLYKKLKYVFPGFSFYLILIDIISHLVFILLKFFKKKMQSESYNNKVLPQSVKNINSQRQLNYYGDNYFIFANFIYSTDHLITQHPGGYQLIDSIKTKSVDRFLYEQQSVQKHPSVSPRSHSYNSIKLAGEPIGRINIINPYKNMSCLNEVQIGSAIKINSYSDYQLIYIKDTSTQNVFKYRGYTDIKQLGQYYALTSGNKTRLYSVVNFLRAENIQIMKMIWQPKNVNLDFSRASYNSNSKLIPLLVKKYHNKSFADQQLTPQNEKLLTISEPRGLGLNLEVNEPGIIQFFAGGTGMNPFCDLIDLLYKDKLIKQSHPLSPLLLQNDLILKTSPFDKYKFMIFLALDSIASLHQITLFQCKQLCKAGIINLKTKITDDEGSWLSDKHPQLIQIQQNFAQIIKNQIRNPQISKIYVCGPPKMAAEIMKSFNEYKFPKQKYYFM